MNRDDADRLFTVADAAIYLGMTRQGVRALEERGHLVAERTVGGWRLFRAGDLERLRERRGQRSNRRQPIPRGEKSP